MIITFSFIFQTDVTKYSFKLLSDFRDYVFEPNKTKSKTLLFSFPLCRSSQTGAQTLFPPYSHPFPPSWHFRLANFDAPRDVVWNAPSLWRGVFFPTNFHNIYYLHTFGSPEGEIRVTTCARLSSRIWPNFGCFRTKKKRWEWLKGQTPKHGSWLKVRHIAMQWLRCKSVQRLQLCLWVAKIIFAKIRRRMCVFVVVWMVESIEINTQFSSGTAKYSKRNRFKMT